jgi:TonB family protein
MNRNRIWTLVVALLCAVSSVAYTQEQDRASDRTVVPSWANTNAKGEVVFTNPMEMPRFPGCEELAQDDRHPCSINKLVAYISKNVKYPAAAKDQKVEGTVIVEFIVDKKGHITEPKIKQSVSASLDAEALRVVSSMPRWIPGKEEGTIVNSYMNFPIKFTLDSETK